MSSVPFCFLRPLRLRWRASILGLLAACLCAAPAAAQSAAETRALVQRLERLEQDLNAVQRHVYRGAPATTTSPSTAAPAPSNTVGLARIAERIDQLEAQTRNLTGQIEENDHRLRQIEDRLTRFMEDVDFRLRGLEQAQAAGSPAPPGREGTTAASPTENRAEMAAAGSAEAIEETTNPGADSAAGRGAPPQSLGTLPLGSSGGSGGNTTTAALPSASSPPEELYEQGISFLRGGDYDAAGRAFQAFVSQHPDHPLAGNAQYWLAESHYVRRQYREAAEAFLDGFQKYPDSPKGSANLLKLGMTLGQMGQKEEACVTLREVSERFPDAPGALRERAEQERRTLDCGG